MMQEFLFLRDAPSLTIREFHFTERPRNTPRSFLRYPIACLRAEIAREIARFQVKSTNETTVAIRFDGNGICKWKRDSIRPSTHSVKRGGITRPLRQIRLGLLPKSISKLRDATIGGPRLPVQPFRFDTRKLFHYTSGNFHPTRALHSTRYHRVCVKI